MLFDHNDMKSSDDIKLNTEDQRLLLNELSEFNTEIGLNREANI